MGTLSASTPIIDELRAIAAKHEGRLHAEEVVKAARSQNSPLHDKFMWDDTEAAHQYRLEQARHLIRTTIQYIDVGGSPRPVNVFVSLSSDREDGGGYRELQTVLKKKEHREVLLADALKEMRSFVDRYETIKRLSKVVGEMKRILKTVAA